MTNPTTERRTNVRVTSKGTVSIRGRDYDVRGRVANVSLGGLSARTLVTPPARLLRAIVELEVRFDTQQSAWLHLTGVVSRIAATGLAVEFATLPDGFAALVDEALTASYSRHRTLAIVLVDATLERRLRMAEAFRVAGCAVVDVSSPLEAIVRLGEFHFEPDLIAIANSLPTTISGELREFVGMEHPRARLVTIGDDIDGPEGLLHWLSATNPGDDLAARIRAVLTKQ